MCSGSYNRFLQHLYFCTSDWNSDLPGMVMLLMIFADLTHPTIFLIILWFVSWFLWFLDDDWDFKGNLCILSKNWPPWRTYLAIDTLLGDKNTQELDQVSCNNKNLLPITIISTYWDFYMHFANCSMKIAQKQIIGAFTLPDNKILRR